MPRVVRLCFFYVAPVKLLFDRVILWLAKLLSYAYFMVCYNYKLFFPLTKYMFKKTWQPAGSSAPGP
jgi:hypothetical protein